MNTVLFHKTVNSSKSDNICFRNQPLQPLSIILRVLLIFGIDINVGDDFRVKTWVLSCIRTCVKILWAAMVLEVMTFVYYFINLTGERQKISGMKRIWELGGILMWFLLFRSRRRLSAVIQEIQKLEKECENRSCLFGLMCIAWLVLVFIGGNLSVIYRDSKAVENTFSVMTFGYLHLNSNAMFLCFHALVIIYVTFFYILPSCVVILYVILCTSCENAIKHHTKINLMFVGSNVVNNDSFQKCIIRYSSLLGTLHSFESGMSVLVFVVVSINVFGVFFGFLSFFRGDVDSLCFGTLFEPTYSFLSFSFILFSAVKVNEADSFARQSNNQVLQQLASPVVTTDMIKFLASNNGPSFVLTAWGTLKLNKSFLLATIGCILTYSLLIKSL